MRNKKQYRIDLWLFLGSVAVLLYFLFMIYSHTIEWDNKKLKHLLEFMMVPIILLGCLIPVVVVYRFISKKTESRTFSMMAVLLSLVTAVLINYMTIV